MYVVIHSHIYAPHTLITAREFVSSVRIFDSEDEAFKYAKEDFANATNGTTYVVARLDLLHLLTSFAMSDAADFK